MNRYTCVNCEMSYHSPFPLDHCAHCGGFLARAYTPTDVPGTIALQRNELEEQIVARSMDEIMLGFENLLAGRGHADEN